MSLCMKRNKLFNVSLQGNALVVLGDPIGDTKAFQSLLIDFITTVKS